MIINGKIDAITDSFHLFEKMKNNNNNNSLHIQSKFLFTNSSVDEKERKIEKKLIPSVVDVH